ncbi:DUF6442 family protein [Miniphocaeibacter halophilus]|uniref:Uncharacterized protein n=1 Tax=Miniphocaeibacter halophilus TaxID=2931922 RepID=A0AC61MML0_9FIRM|nr:DUF6442 family protein [Miniphocaeibacter halophilus]QQK06895.1 hypothetical protein JFY71_05970 [Miniphocaeibacter halophilus]
MKNLNKDEILKKARNENKLGDERDREIFYKSYSFGYRFIIRFFILLTIVAFFQKLFTGKPFADIEVLFFAIWVGILGESIGNYFYTKEKSSLLRLGLVLLAVILTLVNIIIN